MPLGGQMNGFNYLQHVKKEIWQVLLQPIFDCRI